ncbi:SPOR domain-containing protein [Novosphingobium sp. PhB165]|uniref:SPOR domain-containing protein n=1 Tax=Novosphingobium sp. PhB165 TaxID=2485105 RepID=UPI001053D12D|nr:SPOR domain-containing protein [Novosphingobium sp. PhB165]
MLAPIALVLPQAASAQSAPVVARPVVQAIPGAESQRLSAALARLGRNPRDAAALMEAADAARALNDFDAAIGFYRRADEITPGNARVKAGLAASLAMNGDPVSAIPLFAEAEKAGAAPSQIAADRGLAYDLVGANATAQHYYATALGSAADEEVRMRLAISQAIAGDNASAQTTLMPLLQKQDKPGWRTRAFALAIAGETQQAVDVSNSILPPQLAQSIAPYLRYMPRLTRAQQASAANLGKFPRASEIGHDDPRISAYAVQLAATEAAMAPRTALAANQTASTRASSRSGRKAATPLAAARTALTPGASPVGPVPPSTTPARVGLSSSTTPPRTSPPVHTVPDSARVAPPEPMPTIERDASGELLPVTPGRAAAASPAPAALAPSRAPLSPAPVRTAPPPPVSSVPAVNKTPTPGFDLARGQGASAPVSAAPVPTPTPTPTKLAGSESPPEPNAHQLSLTEIFADLGKPTMQDTPADGAVDIRQIKPTQPEPIPAPKVPAKPETKPDAKPEAKATGKPDAKAEAKPDAKATDKPDAKADTKPGAKGDTKAGAKGDTKPGAKGDTKAGAKADAKPGTKGDAKGDTPAKGKKPAAPTHPSRMWVQIGVGRNKDAIAFDWRRNLKQAPSLFKGHEPYVTDMGRTNRVLIGPFETQKAANAFLAEAKKQGFADALPWTSPAGQVVDPLQAK